MNASVPYPLKRLDEVAEFLDGMRRNLPQASRRPGPYPYYGVNGQQGSIDAYLFDEPLVLLAEDLSAGRSRPIAQAIRGKAWVSKSVHVLRPSACIHPEFLCRALEDLDVSRYVGGARRDRLTRSRAAEIRVPLPTLEQQRSIATMLELADLLRKSRKSANAQLDAFVRVYFLEHFGDPQLNTRRWPRLPFDLLCKIRSSKDESAGSSDAHHEGERLVIDASGPNLVTRLAPIARIVVAPSATLPHPPGERYRGIVIAANGRSDLYYLQHALELIELKPYLVSAGRPRLKRTALERIPIPVPPLEMQRAFRALVEKVERLKALQAASRERLDELYAALRTRAMRGHSLTADR